VTSVLNRPQKRQAYDSAYNLFSDPRRPAIYCAVPEHYPVPHFLDRWTFEGSLRSPTELPLGFHRRAADAGVRCNGFYLFQLAAEPQRAEKGGVPRTLEEPMAGRVGERLLNRLNDNRTELAEVG
jgi:hypothetical protein